MRGASVMAGEDQNEKHDGIERQGVDEILLIFGRLGRAVTDAIAARVDPALAGNAEVFVVALLHLHGPQQPSEIASAVGMSSGGVTKLVDRLEVAGYVSRELGAIKTDRRATRVVLTPKGADLAGEYAAALLSVHDEVEASIEELHTAIKSVNATGQGKSRSRTAQ